jgi:hypothetical protein
MNKTPFAIYPPLATPMMMKRPLAKYIQPVQSPKIAYETVLSGRPQAELCSAFLPLQTRHVIWSSLLHKESATTNNRKTSGISKELTGIFLEIGKIVAW